MQLFNYLPLMESPVLQGQIEIDEYLHTYFLLSWFSRLQFTVLCKYSKFRIESNSLSLFISIQNQSNCSKF